MFLMNSSPMITCCCQSPIVKLPINIKYKNYTTTSNLFLYNPTVHNNKSSNAVFVPPLHALPGNSSEQKWTHEGLITESLPDLMFRVRLDNGDVILGYLSGKMKQNHIRILVGDTVKVEVSRYDSTRGRITYRQDSRDRVDRPPKKIKRKGFQDNKPKR